MRNPRIYCDLPLDGQSLIELPPQATQHVAKVLRMQAGDPLRLFNGQGGEWQARIAELGKKQVSVELLEFRADDRQSPLRTELGQVLSRGERMDYAIQKATEMGVSAITPLLSERCEVKLKGERLDKRLEHWRQIAISACEQCGRNRLPDILPPQSVAEWSATRTTELALVLHHRTAQRLEELAPPTSVALLIGPEGGLTAEEIATAEANGFRPVALGPRVLRTETAPIAALSLLQYFWGDY